MVFVRLYLLLAAITVAVSLVVGLSYRDARWFRFAWQLVKLSALILVVVLGLGAAARFLLH